MQTDTIYNETYVRQTPYYHEEVAGPRDGEAGIPLPYSVAGDSFMAIGFMVCMVVSVLSIAKSWRFTCYQLKYLIRMPRENSFEMRETLSEMQYQAYFWLQGMALFTLLAYDVAKTYVAQEYAVEDYVLMAVFFAEIAGYVLLESLLGAVVHPVFFPKSQRTMAGISKMFLMAMLGALMLPVMLMSVYYQLNTENTLYATLGVVIFTQLLRFYKVFRIFFRKDNRFLQFFLYLCTLEAIPLVLLIGVLYFTANYLKINI